MTAHYDDELPQAIKLIIAGVYITIISLIVVELVLV